MRRGLKKFDFVVRADKMIYGIETNFILVMVPSLMRLPEATNAVSGSSKDRRF